MFHGFDFDNTMLRIGSMNMLLHGVENPDIRYRDSLAQDHAGEEEKYTLLLANPPFAGSLDYENTAKDLLQIVKTKKTELLFLALFLRLLKPGGRAAVIVPDGVLFGSSRRTSNCAGCWSKTRSSTPWSSCPAASSSPTPACPPRSCCSPRPTPAAPTRSGSTTSQADGWSLDDKRTPLLRKTSSARAAQRAGEDEHGKNNLPDVLARWAQRNGAERERPRTAQSFCVPKADIAAQGYDLSLNRYKEVVHEAVEHRAPKEILADPAGEAGGGDSSAGDEGVG
jgi:type I restriction enzyme M protein